MVLLISNGNISCRLPLPHASLATTAALLGSPSLLEPAVKASSAFREHLSPTNLWEMGPVAPALQVPQAWV